MRFRSTTVRVALVAMAIACLTRAGAAQVVRARAIADGKGLPGALLSLRDETGRVVLRIMADDFGSGRLGAPAAGTYRVRADAIGHEFAISGPLRVGAGDSVTVQLELNPKPLRLNDLVVATKARAHCRLDSAEGTLLAQLWEEARKALLSTQLTRLLPLELAIRTYERRLNSRQEILHERSDSARSTTSRPFVAADPELLHERGYVQQQGFVYDYFGPDADLLLSERFLEDHCFSVARKPDDTTRVGLAFEPAPNRLLPDVVGTLWLDARSAELREVEFRYANVDLPSTTGPIGGHVEFARLPTGAWIVSRWYIRMPRVVQIAFRVGRRDSVAGYQESGGEARQASAAVDRTVSVLAGAAFDSTVGRPLEGVAVSISGGAYADTTGPDGRFRLTVTLAGDFVVSFSHPRFAVLGFDPPVGSARLARGTTATVDIAVPSRETLARAICGEDSTPAKTSALIAQVVDRISGQPLTGATVTIRLGTFEIREVPRTPRSREGSQVAIAVSQHGTELSMETDSKGLARFCGLPPTKPQGFSVTVTIVGRPKVVRLVDPEGSPLVDLTVPIPGPTQ